MTPPQTIADLGKLLTANVGRVIVGKDAMTELLLVAMLCEGHVLLEDVPGTGKTTLARALARSLDAHFTRIQFTPDLLPSDVTGLTFYNQKNSEFEFRAGPIFGQVVLADEINRATPRTQSALLEAMQERTVTLDGITHRLPRPFLVLATQNPVELEGTFPLPEAQLDRFLLKVSIGYPSADEEAFMLERFDRADPLNDLQAVLSAEDLVVLQARVPFVTVDEVIRQYIVAIVRATRDDPTIALGASPRASLALHRTSQARAALQGREFVLPDDVKALAPTVLGHRLMLNSDARLRGRTAGMLVKTILDRVPAPVEG